MKKYFFVGIAAVFLGLIILKNPLAETHHTLRLSGDTIQTKMEERLPLTTKSGLRIISARIRIDNSATISLTAQKGPWRAHAVVAFAAKKDAATIRKGKVYLHPSSVHIDTITRNGKSISENVVAVSKKADKWLKRFRSRDLGIKHHAVGMAVQKIAEEKITKAVSWYMEHFPVYRIPAKTIKGKILRHVESVRFERGDILISFVSISLLALIIGGAFLGIGTLILMLNLGTILPGLLRLFS